MARGRSRRARKRRRRGPYFLSGRGQAAGPPPGESFSLFLSWRAGAPR
jgi:hypothetical protein